MPQSAMKWSLQRLFSCCKLLGLGCLRESNNPLQVESDSESSFDFHTYLIDLTRDRWQIHELSGGHANHTVRAIRQSAVSESEQDAMRLQPSPLDDHPSIVLKQAPPYFAKHPDMSFSTYRQVSISSNLYSSLSNMSLVCRL